MLQQLRTSNFQQPFKHVRCLTLSLRGCATSRLATTNLCKAMGKVVNCLWSILRAPLEPHPAKARCQQAAYKFTLKYTEHTTMPYYTILYSTILHYFLVEDFAEGATSTIQKRCSKARGLLLYRLEVLRASKSLRGYNSGKECWSVQAVLQEKKRASRKHTKATVYRRDPDAKPARNTALNANS